MKFVTDFADGAVMLPLAAVVALALLLLGWRRGAIAWVATIASMLALMLVLKLLGDWALGSFGLRSPSGHTAAAGAMYGGIVALLVARSSAGAALTALACCVTIAATRIGLGAHSLPEVLLGGLVGVVATVVLRRMAGPRPPTLDRRRLALVVAAAALALHGQHLSLEDQIDELVRGSRDASIDQPHGYAGRDAGDATWAPNPYLTPMTEDRPHARAGRTEYQPKNCMLSYLHRSDIHTPSRDAARICLPGRSPVLIAYSDPA